MSHRNLLIVLAHGLRSDALSDERQWPLATPRLDALGRAGLRLVATSACPADPGAMRSLLTGLHARQHGALGHNAPNVMPGALPAWLRGAGYHTVGVGDLAGSHPQFNEAIAVQGVEQIAPDPSRCWYAAAARRRGHLAAISAQRRRRARNGPFAADRLLLDPEEDIDGFIAAHALLMAEELPGDRPWALVVIFTGPGNDLPAPVGYDGLAEARKLTAGFAPADLAGVDQLAQPAYPRYLLQNVEAHHAAQIRADYLGRVAMFDHDVGALHQKLQTRGDAHRHWTLLSSDRGHLIGERGLFGPRSFLAGAVEVPLILSPPAGMQGPAEKFQDGLFSTVDVAPTVAALARIGALRPWPGRSVLPLFARGGCRAARQANFSEFHDRTLVETERYKAVFRRPTGRCLGLFDLVRDPEERCNLAGRSGMKPTLARLRQHLADAVGPLRVMEVDP